MNNPREKIYYVSADVINASGQQTWSVKATCAEEALRRRRNGQGELEEDLCEVEVTALDEYYVSSERELEQPPKNWPPAPVRLIPYEDFCMICIHYRSVSKEFWNCSKKETFFKGKGNTSAAIICSEDFAIKPELKICRGAE